MSFAPGSKVCIDGPVKSSITLGKLLKSGGAGSVFLIREMPTQVAKIYHRDLSLAVYERKLKAMLLLTPNLPEINEAGNRFVQIAWPQAILRDDRGHFVGFTMPLLDIKATSELEYILQERQARAEGLPTGLGTKITLAANLSAVIAELHRQHHYVVDMKPVNLRFYRQSLYMAMLDCDGFSIQGQGERFEAPQFTPDYLAPEFQVKGIDTAGEEQQDRFALAVVIFQLLNFGIHPFTGKPTSDQVPTDIPGRIAARCYAYGLRPHKAITPSMVSGHEAINGKLRHLFDRAFESTGLTRPSADEWASALKHFAQKATGSLVVCKANREHQHFVESHCAACNRDALLKKARQAPRTPSVKKAHVTMRPALKQPARATAKSRRSLNKRSLRNLRSPVPVKHQPVSIHKTKPYPFKPYVSPYTPPPPTRIAVLLWLFRNPAVLVIIIFGVFGAIQWNSKATVTQDYQEYGQVTRPSSADAEALRQLDQRLAKQRELRSTAFDIAVRNQNYESENPLLPPPDMHETDNLIGKAAMAMSSGNIKEGSEALRAIGLTAVTLDKTKPTTVERHKAAFGRYLSSRNNSSPEDIEKRQAVLMAEFAEILSRDPVASKTADELAWLSLLTKEAAEARRYFTQAIWAEPRSAVSWYGLGMSMLWDSNVDDESLIGVFTVAEILTQQTHATEKVNSKVDYIFYQHAPEEQARFVRFRTRARQIVDDMQDKGVLESKSGSALLPP